MQWALDVLMKVALQRMTSPWIVLGEIEIHMEKKWNLILTDTIAKFNTPWKAHPNVKYKIRKHLEEIRGYVYQFGIYKDFLSRTHCHWRERYIKIKNFCSPNDPIKGVKRWVADREEIFMMQQVQRAYIRIHKELLQIYKKIFGDLNRHFTKRLTEGQANICSQPQFFIRQMWIKTVAQYHYVSTRMATIKELSFLNISKNIGI